MADLLKKLNLDGAEYELGMASAERAKLDAIEAQAQVNKMEGVQVNGTDLTIDSSKKVNIDLATPISEAVSAAKTELNGTISGVDSRLQAVEAAYETKDNVVAAKEAAIAASAVTIAETAGSGDILKTYTFSQNGAEIGKINLAKDLVVNGGEIVEKGGVKYLSLNIANQDTPVEIPVADLVDVYTGSTYITITDGNVVELKVDDLDAYLVAEESAVGAKMKANADAAAAADEKGAQGIADAAAALAHSQEVRADLGTKADSADSAGTAFARIAKLAADLNSLSGGAGSVSDQIDAKLATYNTSTVQPIVDRVTANETKLAGVATGANKVEMAVNGETLYVTIANA